MAATNGQRVPCGPLLLPFRMNPSFCLFVMVGMTKQQECKSSKMSDPLRTFCPP